MTRPVSPMPGGPRRRRSTGRPVPSSRPAVLAAGASGTLHRAALRIERRRREWELAGREQHRDQRFGSSDTDRNPHGA
jgi:hypothetical protein